MRTVCDSLSFSLVVFLILPGRARFLKRSLLLSHADRCLNVIECLPGEISTYAFFVTQDPKVLSIKYLSLLLPMQLVSLPLLLRR